MLSAKRVIIATICGAVFGVVCMYLASSNPNATEPLSASVKWSIFFSRTVMGFAIGISVLPLAWWLHGIVMGIIFSLPLAFGVLDRFNIFIGTIVLGIVYAVLTELITTVIFKAKAVTR